MCWSVAIADSPPPLYSRTFLAVDVLLWLLVFPPSFIVCKHQIDIDEPTSLDSTTLAVAPASDYAFLFELKSSFLF